VVVWVIVEPSVEVIVIVTPGKGLPLVQVITLPLIILELREMEEFET
jgi:hypothetical protein